MGVARPLASRVLSENPARSLAGVRWVENACPAFDSPHAEPGFRGYVEPLPTGTPASGRPAFQAKLALDPLDVRKRGDGPAGGPTHFARQETFLSKLDCAVAVNVGFGGRRAVMAGGCSRPRLLVIEVYRSQPRPYSVRGSAAARAIMAPVSL